MEKAGGCFRNQPFKPRHFPQEDRLGTIFFSKRYTLRIAPLGYFRVLVTNSGRRTTFEGNCRSPPSALWRRALMIDRHNGWQTISFILVAYRVLSVWHAAGFVQTCELPQAAGTARRQGIWQFLATFLFCDGVYGPRFPLLSIAALSSTRTNLSPFTKGCREWGASMRIDNFWRLLEPNIHDLFSLESPPCGPINETSDGPNTIAKAADLECL